MLETLVLAFGSVGVLVVVVMGLATPASAAKFAILPDFFACNWADANGVITQPCPRVQCRSEWIRFSCGAGVGGTIQGLDILCDNGFTMSCYQAGINLWVAFLGKDLPSDAKSFNSTLNFTTQPGGTPYLAGAEGSSCGAAMGMSPSGVALIGSVPSGGGDTDLGSATVDLSGVTSGPELTVLAELAVDTGVILTSGAVVDLVDPPPVVFLDDIDVPIPLFGPAGHVAILLALLGFGLAAIRSRRLAAAAGRRR